MDSKQLIPSLTTIPNESYIYPKKLSASITTYSYSNFKESIPLKFPKKPIRKQTQQNVRTQTIQNPEKSSVRNFGHAHLSTIFDEPERRRRISKPGLFHSLSVEQLTFQPIKRSVEDLGVIANRKKINPIIYTKPNPIVIGEQSNKHNSALEKVWGEQRRYRDNGKNCQQTLNWNTKKKMSSNTHRYGKATKEGKNRFSIIC